MDYTGKIVEYRDGDELRLAWVEKQAGSRLSVITETGRQDKLAERDVLLAHAPVANPRLVRQFMTELKAHLARLAAAVDTDLLWQGLGGTAAAHTLADLGRLYFGQPTTDQLGALLRRLLADPVHFRWQHPCFTARSAADVATHQAAERRRREHADRERRWRQWAAAGLAADRPPETPPEVEPFLRQLEDYLRQHRPNDASALLATLDPEANVAATAFDLLMRAGRLNPDTAALLQLAGLAREFQPATLARAAAIEPFAAAAGREDFSALPCLSIDDEDTREIDDALTLEPLAAGGWRLGVHIADVAHFVAQGDPLDDEALRRGATLYLPTDVITMLPERLGCDLASLTAGQPRPSFSFIVEFDAAGRVTGRRLCRGVIRVAHRLTYDAADELMAGGTGPLADTLRQAHRLTRALLATRLQAGAIVIERADLKVRVSGDTIACTPIPAVSASRELVSETMVLANRLGAELARDHDVPVIYRAQDEPDEPARRYRGRVVGEAAPNVFRGLKRGRLSLRPQRHAGLGVAAYAQLTSPLRRFGDLVLQRQMAAWLSGQPLPYTAAGLLEVIGNAETVEHENRELERRAARYWQLEFLARHHRDEDFAAVVVSRLPGGSLVALKPWGIRGKLATSDELEPGQAVRVRIAALEPRLGLLRLIGRP